jgi:hypothetical protein
VFEVWFVVGLWFVLFLLGCGVLSLFLLFVCVSPGFLFPQISHFPTTKTLLVTEIAEEKNRLKYSTYQKSLLFILYLVHSYFDC